jgi:hypothetical protein
MALTRSIQAEYGMGFPSIPLETWKEGATQTFLEGEVLVASSGYAVVGTAGDDAPTLGTILGIAQRAGRNVSTYPDVEFVPAITGLVFSAQLQNGAGTAAIEQTDIGTKYGLNVTSNKWWVDKDDTTDERVVIVGFKDAVGTTNGVVYFMFLPNTSVYNATAAN